MNLDSYLTPHTKLKMVQREAKTIQELWKKKTLEKKPRFKWNQSNDKVEWIEEALQIDGKKERFGHKSLTCGKIKEN